NIFVNADLRAGPVRGYLNADLGFDLMLRDYGNAVCAGSGQQIGMNGWYAAGQAWAYLEGGVELFGVPIFEAGIAGVLQARLPNPFWAKATMAAKVKLLFVQKTVRFDVEIGEQCNIVDETGQVVNENPVINYLDPFQQAVEVATDAQPAVFFTVPIDRVYEDSNGETFRAKVTKTELTSLGNGYPIGYREEIGKENTDLKLIPNNFLPPEDSIRFLVEVTIYKGNAPVATETQSVVFYTGKDYTDIPLNNVAYSYPADGMLDFYPREYKRHEGFIQLVSGQSSLLENLQPGEKNVVVLSTTEEDILLDVEYDNLARLLTFSLPPETLQSGAVYELKVASSKKGTITRQLLSGIFFRVSSFDLFNEKMALLAANPAADQGPGIGGIGPLLRLIDGEALIGEVERTEYLDRKPMVRFEADLNNFYVRQYDNILYRHFPQQQKVKDNCKK
ncbi:MAG: hypothetical protein AAFN92_19225, partial [Bacteroidota bacterium]